MRPFDEKAHLAWKNSLANKLHDQWPKIQAWFKEQAGVASTPFYCSVDLRDSGDKIVPVDNNLFPAGFNNLCPEDHRTLPEVFRNVFKTRAEKLELAIPKQILLIPEFHTTNAFYIDNLIHLKTAIEGAGFKVWIGWIPEIPNDRITLQSATMGAVDAQSIYLKDGCLHLNHPEYSPEACWTILNNDFSGGIPELLKNVDQTKQPIFPSFELGWHQRKKSRHFHFYNDLAHRFCSAFQLNPFNFTIETEELSPVDFEEESTRIALQARVTALLDKLKAQYQTEKVERPPFLFVKNNAGTYGMGIMVVHSASELNTLNRREKNKMSTGKNKRPIDSVVLQEGIPTSILLDRLPAEPVVYMIGCEWVGGFFRTNSQRGNEDNLNSQGMVFRKMCMSDLRALDESGEVPDLEIVYGTIARLSALAAGLEIQEILKGTH